MIDSIRLLLLITNVDVRGCCESLLLLLNKFRIKKNQSLLHHLERLCHALVVILELCENLAGLWPWQVNQKGLRSVRIVSGDVQVVVLGIARNLNNIVLIVLREILHFFEKDDSVRLEIGCLLNVFFTTWRIRAPLTLHLILTLI